MGAFSRTQKIEDHLVNVVFDLNSTNIYTKTLIISVGRAPYQKAITITCHILCRTTLEILTDLAMDRGDFIHDYGSPIELKSNLLIDLPLGS